MIKMFPVLGIGSFFAFFFSDVSVCLRSINSSSFKLTSLSLVWFSKSIVSSEPTIAATLEKLVNGCRETLEFKVIFTSFSYTKITKMNAIMPTKRKNKVIIFILLYLSKITRFFFLKVCIFCPITLHKEYVYYDDHISFFKFL